MISPATITVEELEARAAANQPKIGHCLACGVSTDLTVPNYVAKHRSWCYFVTAERTYEIEIVD